MEELDLLKKDWKKNNANFPELSEKEIYGMLHKKSSSIVKWILIISIIEFTLWGGISLLHSMYGNTEIKPPLFIVILDYFNYGVLVFFITLFYVNYKNISTEKPVKDLMLNILKVRKIVNYYVAYNILIILFSSICGIIMYESVNYPAFPDGYRILVIAIGVFLILLMVGIIYLIYKIIYGRLSKKLLKNYIELEKIKL